MAIDKKEMWVDFAKAAQSRYVIPDEIEDADDLVDDMVSVSTKYADSMLDEFEERFEKTASRGRRTRKPAADEPEED